MAASISASPTRAVEVVDQSVLLRDVSWESYERLLRDAPERVVPRITFDRGCLEIMSPSRAHEQANGLLSVLVDVVADELGIAVVGAGSTTFRRATLEGGFEPDACFHIANEAIARTSAGSGADLPPDLLIEIDETVNSWTNCRCSPGFSCRRSGDRHGPESRSMCSTAGPIARPPSLPRSRR